MARVEPPAGQAAEPVPITRYPNRRLYDVSQARYITLPEIAELVRQGRTVTVRDSKTGEDLTRSILTQIILEQHPERMELFPVGVLNSIIQANDSALRFLREYLQQSLTYLELLRQPAAINPLLPLQWMRAFLPSPSPPGPAAAERPPGSGATVTEADPAALSRRIAELERRLDAFQGEADKPRPAAAGRKSRRREKPGDKPAERA
jgi:polyhydroxyalkanoate synthesis repressor PhaR